MIEVLAIIAALLFGIMAVIQIALALGAPWGAVVYGGRAAKEDGRLPLAYRIGSGVAAALDLLFALVILTRGGVIGTSGDSTLVTVMSWAIVAYMAINTPMNIMGKHWVERYVFGGMTTALVVICAIVAAAGPS